MAELLCKQLTEKMLKVSQVKNHITSSIFLHNVTNMNGTASIIRQPIEKLSTTCCSSHLHPSPRFHDRHYRPYDTSTVNQVIHTRNGWVPVVLIRFMSTEKGDKGPGKGSKSGNEIDIKRKNPYADMSTGEKGK